MTWILFDFDFQNRKMPIYEAISMANTSELNYLQWTIPAKYGKIVSVWNDDRTVSTPAVTGFSYLNSDGRIMLIHLDAPYMGPVRLGLLYIPNPE